MSSAPIRRRIASVQLSSRTISPLNHGYCAAAVIPFSGVLNRASAVVLRTFGGTSTSAPAQVAAAVADKGLIDMMTASAHWSISEHGFLAKDYEFRDAKTAQLFVARANDLWPKLCCPAQDLAQKDKIVTVAIKDASGIRASEDGEDTNEPTFRYPARQPTGVEADIALALDDVAAELQLGGRWN